MYYYYLILISISFIFFNKFLLKKRFLINESGDLHQKFTTIRKVPLSGGLLYFLGFLFLIKFENLGLLLVLFLFLILGIFSDLKIIVSAKIKLLSQFFAITIYIIFFDLTLNFTKIEFLDYLLNIKLLNYFFLIFCILVIVNGSNFFDGLNTLNIFYYILITLALIFLNITNEVFLVDNILFNLLLLLIVLYFFNLFDNCFLGDSGSYLLGLVFSLLLIDIYNSNNSLSPFFIILLLWYPGFENLFSIIRKKMLQRSSMNPDTNHLHQLIFHKLKTKFKFNVFFINLISAHLINLYNFIVFIVAIQNYQDSKFQI